MLFRQSHFFSKQVSTLSFNAIKFKLFTSAYEKNIIQGIQISGNILKLDIKINNIAHSINVTDSCAEVK